MKWPPRFLQYGGGPRRPPDWVFLVLFWLGCALVGACFGLALVAPNP